LNADECAQDPLKSKIIPETAALKAAESNTVLGVLGQAFVGVDYSHRITPQSSCCFTKLGVEGVMSSKSTQSSGDGPNLFTVIKHTTDL
jgi:hypothetical protein